MAIAESIKHSFAKRYGTAEGIRVWRAPGRVNLIGEHTDYSGGFVLPMAIPFSTFVAAAPDGGGRFRVYSENLDESRDWAAGELGSLEPAKGWTDYVVGVARQLAAAGYAPEPVDLYILSEVPTGSGLSSSAALEVSTTLALLRGRPMEKVELARLCQRAENQFVGMPCGIMDQYVSVFGEEHAAVKIDCRSLEHEIVRLPEAVEIMVTNTMVKHELGASAYRERVAECKAAVDAIAVRHPEVKLLRDARLDWIEPADSGIPPVPKKRARHVVSEDIRVEAFLDASKEGNLEKMGRLFTASHRSLQKDYEVSCEELDFLVDEALKVPGVLGSRMTGGGFGGCTVTLMRPGNQDAFREALTAAYQQRFHLTPQFHPSRAVRGSGRGVN